MDNNVLSKVTQLYDFFFLQRYQTFLDSTVPHLPLRWIATLVMMVAFLARVFYLQVQKLVHTNNDYWLGNGLCLEKACVFCLLVSKGLTALFNYSFFSKLFLQLSSCCTFQLQFFT